MKLIRVFLVATALVFASAMASSAWTDDAVACDKDKEKKGGDSVACDKDKEKKGGDSLACDKDKEKKGGDSIA